MAGAGALRALLLLLLVVGLMGAHAAVPYSPFVYGNLDAAPGLEWFQEAKLGMFMHWGPVSQWGTEISFPLVCKSLPCTVEGRGKERITIHTVEELKAHRQAYADLAKTFNPTQFDARAMAQLAKKAGFRYLMYTSMHCDGFVNWPSKLTSYNIMNTPVARDLLGELVDAFRAEGLKVGMYICPSVWANNSYWYPDALTALGPVCRPNYIPDEQPEAWATFTKYLHGLVEELVDLYAPDAFWFDCSNSPPYTDTGLEAVLGKIRTGNRQAVVLTRNGVFSDYFETRDQSEALADELLGSTEMMAGEYFEIPTVLQSSHQWAYDPNSSQKSPGEIIANLILLSSKNGNYLVNVAPSSLGVWAPEAIEVLQAMASWANVSGEAVFGTTPLAPFERDGVFVTSRPNAIYATVPSSTPTGGISHAWTALFAHNSSSSTVNSTLTLPWIRPSLLLEPPSSVQLLGHGDVAYILNSTGLTLSFPPTITHAQLRTFYSKTNQDRAPCATRSGGLCSVYTKADYVLTGTEGFCQTTSNSPTDVKLDLVYNSVFVDNTLSNGTTPAHYSNVDTECYGSRNPGPGLVPLDLYWSEQLKDSWPIASDASRKIATSLGYVKQNTLAYITANVTHPTVPPQAISFKLSFGTAAVVEEKN